MLQDRLAQSKHPQYPPALPGFEHPEELHLPGGLFVSSGLFAQDRPDSARDLSHLHQVRCLLADIDYADYIAHKEPGKHPTKGAAKAYLYDLDSPELEAQLARFFKDVIEPALAKARLPDLSAAVNSGYGFHLYWWLADDQGIGPQIGVARQLNRRLITAIDKAAGVPHFCDKQVKDTGTRIMRIVGSQNVKGSRPRPVRLLPLYGAEQEPPRYALSYFDTLLPGTPPVVRPPSRPANSAGIYAVPRAKVRKPDPSPPSTPEPESLTSRLARAGLSDRLLLERMATSDPAFVWAAGNRPAVGRAFWRGLAVNLAVRAKDLSDGNAERLQELQARGLELFDGLSTGHPGYDPGKTATFWQQAVDSADAAGPLTYGEFRADFPGDEAAWQALWGGHAPAPGSSPAGEASAAAAQLKRDEKAAAAAEARAILKDAGAKLDAPSGDGGRLLPENFILAGKTDTIVADLLLTILDRHEPVVFTQDQLYQYNPNTGLWVKVAAARVKKLVRKLEGQLYVSGWDKKEEKDKHAPLDAGVMLQEKVWKNITTVRSDENDEFFKDPPAGIAAPDKFATIDEGELVFVPHSPSQLSRHSLLEPFFPDGGSRQPEPSLFLQTLSECFALDDDADLKIALLQEFIGACLMGIAPKYTKAMLLLGDGSNGKSLIMQVIRQLFPPASRSNITPAMMGSGTFEYKLADLAGKRLNSVTELQSEQIRDSANFKSVVAGEAVLGRQPAKESFTVHPVAGNLFGANTAPDVRDTTHGFWRRWLVLTFPRIFAAEEQDADRFQTIVEVNGELPAIAIWALHGAVRLVKQGRYSSPPSSVAALQKWRGSADTIAMWLGESVSPTAVSRKEDCTPVKAAYASYQQWCTEAGYETKNIPKRIEFNERLSRDHKKKRGHQNRRWLFKLVDTMPSSVGGHAV